MTIKRGTIVDLEAVADSGWGFSHWEGQVANNNLPQTTVLMDEDKSITAVFEEEELVIEEVEVIEKIEVLYGTPYYEVIEEELPLSVEIKLSNGKK